MPPPSLKETDRDRKLLEGSARGNVSFASTGSIAAPPSPATNQSDRRRRGPRTSTIASAGPVAMEKEYKVETPPRPPRKARRTPVKKRELGLEAACRNGLFVMPKDAYNNSPMVVALCEHNVVLYNKTADLKIMKKSCEDVMAGTDGAIRVGFQLVIAHLNKRMADLRSSVHKYVEHVLEVEGGKPVNKPTNWARV